MPSGSVSLREHLEALRAADKEIARERERALEIKEKADEKALDLAREIQAYKDTKANELREQIASERGTYITGDIYTERHEELIRRISELERGESTGTGRHEGTTAVWTVIIGAGGIIAGLAVAIVSHLH